MLSATDDTSEARTPLLDHGYVRLVEVWGSDERIVEAARMSTGRGFLGWDDLPHLPACPCLSKPLSPVPCPGCGARTGDMRLLTRLYRMRHMTPFEMAGAVFEVQAPIFVFREWHRHRTQSYNEMSARYTPLPDLNYVPTAERLLMNADGNNRQANRLSGAPPLDSAMAEAYRESLKKTYEVTERAYQMALSVGVPKELARNILPVGRYSRMRASANLRNWMQFLDLRMDESAQWEIRQYANAVAAALSRQFPRTMSLFGTDRAST